MKNLMFVIVMCVAGLVACEPEMIRETELPQEDNLGMQIDNLTVLDGFLAGTLHGQDLSSRITEVVGSNRDGYSEVILLTEEGERVYMGAITLNLQLDDPIVMSGRNMEMDSISNNDVSYSMGCSGPAAWQWDRDTAADQSTATVFPNGEQDATLVFTSYLPDNEEITGVLNYRVNRQ